MKTKSSWHLFEANSREEVVLHTRDAWDLLDDFLRHTSFLGG